MSSTQKILKNAMHLYFRMFLVLGVTLYSSRIVLQVLGVSDFGVYNVVGGVVLFLGFFNSALTSASQRYISFELGKGGFNEVNKCFNISLLVHFGLGVVLLIIFETVGLWYVNNMLKFSSDKLYAVNVVYQFSVLSFFVSILQVPYNAILLAKEKMHIYAYISILESLLKLIIIWALLHMAGDKLILYAFLNFVSVVCVRLVVQIYCRKLISECKLKLYKDLNYIKEFISFSSWNLIGSFASVVRVQGNNILLNAFFGTIANAAFGLMNQIQSAINLFVSSFQNAFNPQMVQKYASGDIVGSTQLMVYSSKVSLFMVMIMVIPLALNIEFFLNFWLGSIPPYLVSFTKVVLILVLWDALSGPIMTMISATGKIKLYHIIVGGIMLMSVPISYLFLKNGADADVVVFVMLVLGIFAYFVRVFFLYKLVTFNLYNYIQTVFFRGVIVFITSYLCSSLIGSYVLCNVKYNVLISTVCTVFIVMIISFVIGLNFREKMVLKKVIGNYVK